LLALIFYEEKYNFFYCRNPPYFLPHPNPLLIKERGVKIKVPSPYKGEGQDEVIKDSYNTTSP